MQDKINILKERGDLNIQPLEEMVDTLRGYGQLAKRRSRNTLWDKVKFLKRRGDMDKPNITVVGIAQTDQEIIDDKVKYYINN